MNARSHASFLPSQKFLSVGVIKTSICHGCLPAVILTALYISQVVTSMAEVILPGVASVEFSSKACFVKPLGTYISNDGASGARVQTCLNSTQAASLTAGCFTIDNRRYIIYGFTAASGCMCR